MTDWVGLSTSMSLLRDSSHRVSGPFGTSVDIEGRGNDRAPPYGEVVIGVALCHRAKGASPRQGVVETQLLNLWRHHSRAAIHPGSGVS